MLNALFHISEYFNYVINSTTRHGLHSPFVYDFADHVLYQPSPISFEFIENQRLELINSNRNFINTSLKKYTLSWVLSAKYGKLLQRMMAYYQPRNIDIWGPNTGIELNYALAQNATDLSKFPKITNYAEDRSVADITLNRFLEFSNGMEQFETSQRFPVDESYTDWIIIHQLEDQDAFWQLYEQAIKKAHQNTMMIITNIRHSDNQYISWKQLTHLPHVTASIELYQLGILCFRKEQFQQNFILRY